MVLIYNKNTTLLAAKEMEENSKHLPVLEDLSKGQKYKSYLLDIQFTIHIKNVQLEKLFFRLLKNSVFDIL